MATGRQNVIVMQGSYHGRTFGTMAMTKSKTVYSAGCVQENSPWCGHSRANLLYCDL